MTKRISTLALALAIGATLAACGKSEPAAEAGAAAEHEIKHIGAFDGDAGRGERLAVDKDLAGNGQACVDCHGPGGAKPIAPTYPVLAGQYQDYLFQALHEYRDGEREQVLMNNQIQGAVNAKKLDDQGIADLAAYFAAQNGPLGDLSDR